MAFEFARFAKKKIVLIDITENGHVAFGRSLYSVRDYGTSCLTVA